MNIILRHKSDDFKIMLIVGVMLTLLFNSINFPNQYYSDIPHFLVYSSIFFIQHIIINAVFKYIIQFFLKVFPKEKDTYKRLSVAILIFILISGFVLNASLQLYSSIPWFHYQYSETVFLWNFIAISIFNIFMTFFTEGLRSYNEWKQNAKETEKLDAAYSQSRLNALKSQVNPHFLFNSLNSLSSLIQEDEDKAEAFLNEMSKVYRYMLRNDDEALVTLETELNFIKSYHHLLNARYGDGLQLKIDIPDEELKKFIAPHSLQVIVENAFTQNIVSKTSPLKITIVTDSKGNLIVQNNAQPKTVSDAIDFEAGLDNLVKRYVLLGEPVIVDDTKTESRTIKIPLLEKEEVAS